MENKFGGFLEGKRKEKGITLRAMADLLKIAPSYLSDIEKNRRSAPEKKLDDIARILGLTEQDKYLMHDLAGKSKAKETVAPDVSDFLIESQFASTLLRKVKEKPDSEKILKELIRQLDQE